MTSFVLTVNMLCWFTFFALSFGEPDDASASLIFALLAAMTGIALVLQ